ncbi:MAG: hypothetical protein H8E71_04015 [Candidatus Marinimicrobia bacterium]|nr:hypothetical protein [Candidatus Neomarinimicrobiota bacterium]
MNRTITTNSVPVSKLPHEIKSFGVAWLHTTGPEIARDKIIQVGGIILNDIGERREKTWEINPGIRLTRATKLRSGLIDNDLAEKEGYHVLKDEIMDFYSACDCVFVPSFSNQLDWFRIKVFSELDIPLFDLFTKTQYFLPEIEVFDPAHLYRSITGKTIPKKTLEPILESSLMVLRQISEKILTDKRPFYIALPWLLEISGEPSLQIMSMLIKNIDKFAFEKNLNIFESKKFQVPTSIDTVNVGEMLKPLWLPKELKLLKSTQDTDRQDNPAVKLTPLSKEYAGDILKSTSKMIENYHDRPLQSEYSMLVSKGLTIGDISFIESGTGTGKSLGYCLAAMDIVEKYPGKKILISTATKNLQNQLLEREIPRLSKRFPSVKTALLKGKGNYLCLSALQRAFRTWFENSGNVDSDTQEARAAWIYLVNLIHSLNYGDIDAIPRRIYDWFPILKTIIEETNAATHCKKGSCNPNLDIYRKVFQEAIRADIIVANHYKTALLDEEFIQNIDHIIIDEADQFGNAVRSSLSYHMDYQELQRFLRRLTGGKRRGYLKILEEYIAGLKRKLSHKEKIELLEKVAQTQEKADIIIQVMDRFGEILFNEFPIWSQKKILRKKIVKEEQLLQKLDGLKDGKTVKQFSEIISGLYNTLHIKLKDISNQSQLSQTHRDRCHTYALLSEEIVALAKNISDSIGIRKIAHSVTLFGKKHWKLSRHQVYIDEYLKETFYTKVKHIVYTSATMSVNGDFSYMKKNYGAYSEDFSVTEHSMDTIPNFKEQSVAYVDITISEYNYKNGMAMKRWRRDILNAIACYTWAANGRTLVLFTSWNEMKMCYKVVAPFFQKYDIQPLIQNGASLEEIGEFHRNEYSVLFGVDRFWSGVDFPGATLSQIIIVKAPNPSLSDPIIQHRMLYESTFLSNDYSTMAKLKLKQGAGRLIRNENDKGGIVILDSRYGTKYCFIDQLNVLPHVVKMSGNQELIINNIIKKAGLKDEYSGRGDHATSAVNKYFKSMIKLNNKKKITISDIRIRPRQ